MQADWPPQGLPRGRRKHEKRAAAVVAHALQAAEKVLFAPKTYSQAVDSVCAKFEKSTFSAASLSCWRAVHCPFSGELNFAAAR
jgi:hypothetical protein